MIGLEYFLFGYFLIEPKAEQAARVLDLLLSMKIGAKKIKSGAFVLRKKRFSQTPFLFFAKRETGFELPKEKDAGKI